MATKKEPEKDEKPIQDEYDGVGGSYTYDPKTGKRTKNEED
jgi:hypothetical protein